MSWWVVPALAADPVALTSDVSEAEITASIRVLSGADPVDGAPIASRDLHHPDLPRAAAWLEAQLRADGLDVAEFPFAVDGIDGDPWDIVADLPGADAGPAIVLGAHYDSIASFDPDWTDPATDPAPGADDDGSGVAAILAVASRLSAYHPGFRHTVRFVLFSGEEYGLLGSSAWVATLDPADVSAMIQLDSVGYAPAPDPVLWVTFDEQSTALSEEFLAFAPTAAVPVSPVGVPAALIDGDTRSDHYSFWNAGIPALHLASFPLPPTYHTMGDTIDAVDVPFTRDVTAEVGAFTASLAEPLDPPPSPDPPPGCGCAQSGPTGWPGLAVIAVSLRRSRRFHPPGGACRGLRGGSPPCTPSSSCSTWPAADGSPRRRPVQPVEPS